MPPQSPLADLRLEASLLSPGEATALVEAGIEDGFTVLALNRSLTPREPYVPVALTRAFDPTLVALLQRVTLLVANEEELRAARARLSELSRVADLVAVEFSQPEPFEAFLRANEGFGDDLLAVDVRGFAPSAAALKQLLTRPLCLELTYAPIIEAADRRKPLANALRVLGSHLSRVALSSAAAAVYERRTPKELCEFLRGLGGDALARRLPRLCGAAPCEVVQRARFRREGFAAAVGPK